MTVSKRIVSTKVHSIGYVLSDGREYTRNQAVKLAKSNVLTGVRVVDSVYGKYLMGAKRSLYSRPTTAPQTSILRRYRGR